MRSCIATLVRVPCERSKKKKVRQSNNLEGSGKKNIWEHFATGGLITSQFAYTDN